MLNFKAAFPGSPLPPKKDKKEAPAKQKEPKKSK